jgi:hypothetical protein
MFNQWPTTGVILLLGEEALAVQYARKILCENSKRSEALFDSKTHTDFCFIHPDSNSSSIKIDQIRELIEWASGTPQIADKQVAIISPAHLLNIQAANALLKTLEESSPNALFILVSDRPSFIPATIRSRCYWIRCRKKETIMLDSALKIRIAADLQALDENKTDPVTLASQWIKEDPKIVLDSLMMVLQDRIKIMPFTRRDWIFFDKILNAKRETESPNQPNTQLLMESLLI